MTWGLVIILVSGAAQPHGAASSGFDAQPSSTEIIAPLQISVQMGSTQSIHLDAPITKHILADPKVAAVEQRGEQTLSIKGLHPGKTLILVWTAVGRQIIVLRTTHRPQVKQANTFKKANIKRDKNESLYVYRGQFQGAVESNNQVAFRGQHHSLYADVPLLGGLTRMATTFDAPFGERALLSSFNLGYDTRLFSFEAGDLRANSAMTLDNKGLLRGGMATYHDAKYELRAFGGVQRSAGQTFYDVGGPSEFGLQSQMHVADNLTLGAQATRSGTGAYGRRRAQATLNLLGHWQPLPSLSFDSEGAFNRSGNAALFRMLYDAPWLSAHAFYQSRGTNYLSSSARRTDLAQVDLFITPSAYYRLIAIAGYSTSGASIVQRNPQTNTKFINGLIYLFPWGMGSRSRFELTYRGQKNQQNNDQVSLLSGIVSHQTEVAFSSSLARLVDSYRLAAVGQWNTTDTTSGATSPLTRRQHLQSIGANADVALSIWNRRLYATTRMSYLNRKGSTHSAGNRTGLKSHFFQGQETLTATWGSLIAQASISGSREAFKSGHTDALAMFGSLTWRPNLAHELRTDFDVSWRFQDSTDPTGSTDRTVNGMLTYTHYFGDAVDAPSLTSIFDATRITAHVFLDANENGKRDNNEAGLDHAVVYINDQKLTTDDSGVTGMGVRRGAYTVRINLSGLEGYKLTTASMQQLMLNENDKRDVAFGLSDRAQIYGIVFNDAALDGVYQIGEPAMSDVLVRLSQKGKSIAQIKTKLGAFRFKGLSAGTYTVALDPRTMPPGFITDAPSSPNKTSDVSNNLFYLGSNTTTRGSRIAFKTPVREGSEPPPFYVSNQPQGQANAMGKHPRQVEVTIAQGAVAMVRFPVKAMRSIQGRVFSDNNNNGRFDQGDLPLERAQVTLGQRVATTDAEGHYVLRNLVAGRDTITINPASLPRGAHAKEKPVLLSHSPGTKTIDFAIQNP